MDVLQEHLIRARASGGVFARSIARAPWGLRLPGSIQLTLHAVIEGRAWLWVDGGAAPIELLPGRLALVRGGADHFIAHQPGARCVWREKFRSLPDQAADARDPKTSVFLCGAYRFAGDIGAGLLKALPPVLSLADHLDDPIHGVVTLLAKELTHPAPGRQTVLDRLLDVLVVLGIRAGLERSPRPPGWFRAAADPRLSEALQAMHTDPAAPWTVEQLARRSHMSRATFARVFQQMLGQSPIQYLTEWRMALARDLLRTEADSLGEVAEKVGYSSLYAFAAAFQRHHRQPPGRWRREARALPNVETTAAHR